MKTFETITFDFKKETGTSYVIENSIDIIKELDYYTVEVYTDLKYYKKEFKTLEQAQIYKLEQIVKLS